jgi:hypothetical protein
MTINNHRINLTAEEIKKHGLTPADLYRFDQAVLLSGYDLFLAA